MNYLLLMYHPEDYWKTHTDERDDQEEIAFEEFCDWMREMGISWTAHSLEPPTESLVRTFSVDDATNRMLPEIAEVITGFFELSLPAKDLAEAVVERCPHIEGSRVELRVMSD